MLQSLDAVFDDARLLPGGFQFPFDFGRFLQGLLRFRLRNSALPPELGVSIGLAAPVSSRHLQRLNPGRVARQLGPRFRDLSSEPIKALPRLARIELRKDLTGLHTVPSSTGTCRTSAGTRAITSACAADSTTAR